MNTFNRYALMMLKYRGRLVFALVCCFLGSALFSAEVLIALPVLRVIFHKGQGQAVNFRETISRLNETKFHHCVPQFVLDRLPDDIFHGLILLMVFFVLVGIVGAACRVLHGYHSMRVSIATINDIRLKAFSRIIRMPLNEVGSEPVAERVSRMIRDTDRLGKGFAALIGKSLQYALKCVGLVLVALLMNWKIAGLALLAIPILVVVTRWFGKRIRRAARRTLAASAQMLGVIAESLQALRVVKVHTAERIEIGRVRRSNKQLIDLDKSLRLNRAFASPTVETLGTVAFAAIVVFAGWLVFQGYATIDEVSLSIISLLLALTTLQPLTWVLNQVQEASGASDRITEVMESLQEEERRLGTRKKHLPPFHGSIVFDNVTFTYPKAHHPALKNINLVVEHGSTIAFVGPNGCGKTTLLSMVPRIFDPTHGRVLIDGHDLRDISLHSLRKQCSVVTQETILFHDTIAYNIAYGALHVTREQVIEAARHARADDFIQRKENGYDTMVGDRGLTLSGGERQRIAIARAILRDPAILILDEATSMIDADSEAKITEALEEFCKNRTSLVIAHRLSTVVNADIIVVMDHGQIVETGSHTQLLEQCRLYQQLCRTQLVNAADEEPDALDERSPAPTSAGATGA